MSFHLGPPWFRCCWRDRPTCLFGPQAASPWGRDRTETFLCSHQILLARADDQGEWWHQFSDMSFKFEPSDVAPRWIRSRFSFGPGYGRKFDPENQQKPPGRCRHIPAKGMLSLSVTWPEVGSGWDWEQGTLGSQQAFLAGLEGSSRCGARLASNDTADSGYT